LKDYVAHFCRWRMSKPAYNSRLRRFLTRGFPLTLFDLGLGLRGRPKILDHPRPAHGDAAGPRVCGSPWRAVTDMGNIRTPRRSRGGSRSMRLSQLCWMGPRRQRRHRRLEVAPEV
jgi:hypothetical protein